VAVEIGGKAIQQLRPRRGRLLNLQRRSVRGRSFISMDGELASRNETLGLSSRFFSLLLVGRPLLYTSVVHEVSVVWLDISCCGRDVAEVVEHSRAEQQAFSALDPAHEDRTPRSRGAASAPRSDVRVITGSACSGASN